ncbi:Rieske 2Fe-2S domain-containing protein [Sneathiella sp. P13V-1]|uniref:aromatic ring-hydroxylating oxygenase subunit alpha n=1 Tax=Sneathiella sp. P13V-1 TaxID=2697366 RepID=UPI00187B56AA|nr:aromatic ring-hydroxylating dioxygenase subunit alpha [Sneathiella sp. P13V-1]MBE7638292.1 Rieske 2Fe-2S domain-containing protein [Sneathiella sp. P13V-1]
MKRETELELIERCAELAKSNTREMTDERGSDATQYTDPEKFKAELAYMKTLPQMVAHSSELPEFGSFRALDWFDNFPLLLVRDAEGKVHAFANACRHRGSRLEANGSGCKKRFICPYHAWSYDLSGQLKNIPHKEGFPSIDLDDIKLKELPSEEFGGFIWVRLQGEESIDMEASLAGLGADFDWFDSENHVLFAEEEKVWKTNWKILVEGGIESYHFKMAHKNTIAPLFRDTLSVFDEFGPHFRSVLAKNTIKRAMGDPEEEREIRNYANILYSFFPMSSVLVQPDHFAVVQNIPLSEGECRVKVQTFVPKGSVETDKQKAHWQANFEFTRDTLLEDFVLAEEIYHGMKTGATDRIYFGRFENALTRLHEINEAHIEAMNSA